MIRVFCDICGRDITDYTSSRATANLGKLKIEVITAINGVWNGGHVCLDCIRDTCNSLSIKRKPSEPASCHSDQPTQAQP